MPLSRTLSLCSAYASGLFFGMSLDLESRFVIIGTDLFWFGPWLARSTK